MKFREKVLKTGTKIFLGRNAKNNDELVKKYKGKPNVIMHTAAP
jgi:predicted ribosome quality control (RQC) complex YloA/Tae2 family protein